MNITLYIEQGVFPEPYAPSRTEAGPEAFRRTLLDAFLRGKRYSPMFWAGMLLVQHGDDARARARDGWDPACPVAYGAVDDHLARAGLTFGQTEMWTTEEATT